MLLMSKRQSVDCNTAKAVVQGINILSVRNRSMALNYIEYKRVPTEVIMRVLDNPASRRMPSSEQLISEAITPFIRPQDGTS
jgi:hypothetical protein